MENKAVKNDIEIKIIKAGKSRGAKYHWGKKRVRVLLVCCISCFIISFHCPPWSALSLSPASSLFAGMGDLRAWEVGGKWATAAQEFVAHK